MKSPRNSRFKAVSSPPSFSGIGVASWEPEVLSSALKGLSSEFGTCGGRLGIARFGMGPATVTTSKTKASDWRRPFPCPEGGIGPKADTPIGSEAGIKACRLPQVGPLAALIWLCGPPVDPAIVGPFKTDVAQLGVTETGQGNATLIPLIGCRQSSNNCRDDSANTRGNAVARGRGGLA